MTMSQQCGICQKDSKYKCTTCRFPFCSVACSNEHRPTCLVQTENVESPVPAESSPVLSEGEKRLEASLRNSSKLKEMFKNRKLREMIVAVDSSPNAPQALESAMTDPDFMEMIQATLEAATEAENS